MEINRLTIVVEGKKEDNTRFGTITINNESILECNVDWIPDYLCDLSGKNVPVHALQWYGDHGEIELTTCGSNIEITELGIFEEAITHFEARKLELQLKFEEEEKARLEIEGIFDDVYFDQMLSDLMTDVNQNDAEETTITEETTIAEENSIN